MKHESAVQAVKELMRKDSVFRSVIQGWGVATLLIGLFMFYMGANTYIQSYKQTDWVFGSAYITDISELNRSKVGRGGINYSMTYEYEVDGTHYTGKYGPLANSIEVGRSIRIKYDPSAPENSTGFLAPSGNDLALVIIGTILAVPGFFMSASSAFCGGFCGDCIEARFQTTHRRKRNALRPPKPPRPPPAI